MPTYEYECSSCESVVEVFHSIKDKGLRTCPKCGSKKIQQIISGGVGLVFKGSGFYVTDSKNSSNKIKATGKEETKEQGTQDIKKDSESPTKEASSTSEHTATNDKLTSNSAKEGSKSNATKGSSKDSNHKKTESVS